jgi:hypothetical protein
MPIVQITTDRLPQADRSRGCLVNVTPEKAQSLIAQGFAKLVEEAPQDDKPKRGRPRKRVKADE